jgi:SAM-dependent methyltransferase
VRQICRGSAWPRYWIPLGAFPWRGLLRAGDVPFGLADKWVRLWSRIAWMFRQCQRLPEPKEVEEAVGRFYSQASMLRRYVVETEEGLLEEERIVMERHLRPGDRILNVGCGAGREAIGFAKLGFQVTGVDASPGMVEKASRHPYVLSGDANIHFVCVSGSEIRFPEGSFRAVYITPGFFQWVPGRSNRVAFLERCRKFVGPGGLVIFSQTPRTPPGRRERLLVNGLRRLTRLMFGDHTPEPGDRWDRYSESPENWTPMLFTHAYYDESEICEEIQAAGLQVIDRVSTFFIAAPVAK